MTKEMITVMTEQSFYHGDTSKNGIVNSILEWFFQRNFH